MARRPTRGNSQRAVRAAVAGTLAQIEAVEARMFLSASAPAFLPATHSALPAAPTAIVTDDFNDDGNEDIAAALGASNQVAILTGNGDGTFSSPALFSTGADPTAIADDDFNNDGNDDLATADAGSGDVSILLAQTDSDDDATGAFAKPIEVHVMPGGAGPMSLTTGDFNDDGNEDIAVAGPSGLFLLEGNGDGTFSAPVKLASGNFAGVVADDFDEDGNLDLAVSDPGDGTVQVLLGAGDGTFSAPTSFQASPGCTALTTGDFNGDGADDIAVAVPGQNAVDVLLARTTTVTVPIDPIIGPIDPGPILPIVASGAPPTSAAAAGTSTSAIAPATSAIATPIVGGSGASSSSDFSYSTGTGAFNAPIIVTLPASPASIAVDDVNGDGIDDIVTANPTANTLSVIASNGDGTFAAPASVAVGVNPVGVAIDDFSGDGGSDLASVDAGGGGAGPGVSVALQQSADVGVSLSATPASVPIGSNVTYTATLTNTGPGATTGVSLEDDLPDGLTLVSVNSSQGTVDSSSDSVSANEASVNLGTLASGASATVTIVAQAGTYGSVSDSAWISSDSVDPNYANNYATVNTSVVATSGAELSLAADPGADEARVGQALTFTFTVTNNGPDSAGGVTFTDTLPAGATYLAAGTSQGSASDSGGVVTADLGALASGASATVTVTVNPSTAGELTDAAAVADNPDNDPFAGDNSATAYAYVYSGKGPIPIDPIPLPIGFEPVVLATGVPTNASGTAASAGTGRTSTAASAGLPALSIANVRQKNVTHGTTQFVFTVTRAGNLNEASTVHYATVNGAAKAGAQFQAASGDLSFAAGASTATIDVAVTGAAKYAPNQAFVVKLTAPQNATLKSARAVGIIESAKKAPASTPKPKPAPTPKPKAVNVNFEPAGAPAVHGYLGDVGLVFGSRGNGYSYGWSTDNTAGAVTRQPVKTARYDTFNLLGSAGASSWQIALPDGQYKVQLSAGDPTAASGAYNVLANGVTLLDGSATARHRFVTGSATVTVANGYLTLTPGVGSASDPLDFVRIKPA